MLLKLIVDNAKKTMNLVRKNYWIQSSKVQFIVFWMEWFQQIAINNMSTLEKNIIFDCSLRNEIIWWSKEKVILKNQ